MIIRVAQRVQLTVYIPQTSREEIVGKNFCAPHSKLDFLLNLQSKQPRSFKTVLRHSKRAEFIAT